MTNETTMQELRAAIELLPEGALVLDSERQVCCLNRQAELWLGLCSQPATERLEACLGPEGWLALQGWLGGSPPEPALLELWLRSGQRPRRVEAARQLVLLESGEHSLITLRDRTAQHERACSERVELSRLRDAILARSIGIYEHDHTTDEIYGSPEVRRHYDLGEAQPLSIEVFAGAAHPDDAAYLVAEIGKAHDPSGDGSFDVRHRIHTPSGETRWLHTCATTYFQETEDGGRRLLRTVGSTLDITHAQRVELETRRLAAILDATPDVVATTDLDGTLTYLNRAGRESLGMALDAPVGALLAAQLIAPAQREQFEKVIVPAATREGVWRGELDLVGHDGRQVPASVIVLALQQPRSLGAYLSVIAHDLSAQKELEAQLLHSQKLEAVGRLAGGVAHDFNNLLSVIIGFTTLVRRDSQVPESSRARLDEVLRAAARAGELTVQLLSFSRKQVLRLRVFEVASLVSALEPMVRRLLGESIDVSVAVDAAARARIKADPSRIEQVLMNLVVNARDAMPNGGRLRIEAALGAPRQAEPGAARELEAQPHVVLSVEDTGQGMSKETMSHLFEPFFTTKAAGQGTGLGLSTVFGIVKQSGGNIRVESEIGQGTTFRVLLPLSDEPLDVVRARSPALKAETSGAVLVVEDEPQLRQVVVTVLEEAGYSPVAASGPEEAIEIVRARGASLRLLLTDIVMPSMSGKRMVDLLAEEGSTLPVLYMSGYARDTIVHHGVLDPGVSLLAKPFTPEQLVERVNRAIADAASSSLPTASERRPA